MTLQMLHWLAGLIVVAEALNKLERVDILNPYLDVRGRITEVLKAVAWLLLGIGGGGAVITPLLKLEAPTLSDVCVALGFAVLIIRTRIKKG